MKTLLSFIAAAILMFSSFLSPAKAIVLFDDVFADHPFAFEIAYLYEEGIINGYPDGTFRPNDPVTRAHAVAMIGRALNLDDTSRSTGFRDVPANHPFSGYIASLLKRRSLSVSRIITSVQTGPSPAPKPLLCWIEPFTSLKHRTIISGI